MNRCSNCNYANKDADEYCARCGAHLESIELPVDGSDASVEPLENPVSRSDTPVEPLVNSNYGNEAPQSVKICDLCGYHNGANAQFCVTCGKKLSINTPTDVIPRNEPQPKKPVEEPSKDLKNCPYCAEYIKKEAIFCRYCGRDLIQRHNGDKYSQKEKKSFSGIGCFSIILILIILLLAVTNPSENKHSRAIYAKVGEINAEIAGPEAGEMGKTIGGFIGSWLERLGINFFEYNNFLLFSTTTNRNQILTFGVFGKVYIIAPLEEFKFKF